MSTSVTLPALGESVTEGTVSRWLKQVGDTVEADEPLLEVSTDKVDTEIPSPASGVLLEIKAQEDETVEVGAVLAVIGEASEADGGGSAPQPDGAESASEAPSAEDAPREGTAEEAAPAAESGPAEEPAPAEEAEQQQPESPAATTEPAPDAEAPSGGAPGSDGATEVTLPELGESVTEGTVSRWLKQVGESVKTDEPLLEVSTDKVDTEIPSPAAGTLLEIRVQEDETVEVGAILAVIGEAGAAPPAQEGARPAAPQAAEPEPQPTPQPARQPAPTQQAEPKAAAPTPKVDAQPEQHGPAGAAPPRPTPVVSDSDASYVTPLVRKLAKEHDVDLGSLNGTGVGGAGSTSPGRAAGSCRSGSESAST
jgi:2-oxoglutarate dehydrogenase E2 component (dihydrolipoamide succinyltransferase)